MVEQTVATQEPKKQQAADSASATAIADSQRSAAPKMEGLFNRHTSGYWAVMLPALSLRYLPEAAAKVASRWNHKFTEAFDTAYGLVTGTLMMGVTSFYAQRTYKDMKNVFAEPVAAETGKKPEDVTFRDILKSDNTLVQAARKNFIKYNMRRYAVNLPFFGKEMVRPFSKEFAVGLGDAAVGTGVATNSAYLVADVFHRKETFFERLQSFVEQKIQHTDQLGEKITALDLVNLYELQARNQNPDHVFNGRMDTPEWASRMKIFGRMAELMNMTYGNEPNKEGANFTLSNMIYLMGHGMIDSSNPERSCSYIEVANQNGIPAVKDVAAHVANGEVKYAHERYLAACPTADCGAPQQEQPKPGFAAKFANEAGQSKTDKIITQRAAANESAYVQTA